MLLGVAKLSWNRLSAPCLHFSKISKFFYFFVFFLVFSFEGLILFCFFFF